MFRDVNWLPKQDIHSVFWNWCCFFERSYLITGLWSLNRNHHMRSSNIWYMCNKVWFTLKVRAQNKAKVITPLDNGKEGNCKNVCFLKLYVSASCDIFAGNDLAINLELVQTKSFIANLLKRGCKKFHVAIYKIFFFCIAFFRMQLFSLSEIQTNSNIMH